MKTYSELLLRFRLDVKEWRDSSMDDFKMGSVEGTNCVGFFVLLHQH